MSPFFTLPFSYIMRHIFPTLRTAVNASLVFPPPCSSGYILPECGRFEPHTSNSFSGTPTSLAKSCYLLQESKMMEKLCS